MVTIVVEMVEAAVLRGEAHDGLKCVNFGTKLGRLFKVSPNPHSYCLALCPVGSQSQPD
jgi:hypothetical protein